MLFVYIGAPLVKGIGFEVTDTEISGPDLFNRLVPLEAHEASSLYSEEKARLLRQVGDRVEEKDAELVVFLSSLKLEEIPNPGDHIALPAQVIGNPNRKKKFSHQVALWSFLKIC